MEKAIFEKVIFEKVKSIMLGELVVMSDNELDWLENNDDGEYPVFYASLPNPEQVGVLDKWIVAKKNHPYIQKARN